MLETYKDVVSERLIDFVFSDDLKNKLERVATWLTTSSKFGLLLYGNFGNGKTTMAKTIKKFIQIINPSANFVQTTAREIGNSAKEGQENFDSFKKYPMLYIDEVGREQTQVSNFGNKINPFVEVLEYRYDKQLLTILTSNLTGQEFKEIYGEYISERIQEMFDKIAFKNQSYRK